VPLKLACQVQVVGTFKGQAVAGDRRTLALVERVNLSSAGRLMSHRPCTFVDAVTALVNIVRMGGRGVAGEVILGRQVSCSGYVGVPPPMEDTFALETLTPAQTQVAHAPTLLTIGFVSQCGCRRRCAM